MSQIASSYAQGLYSLALEENITKPILEQMQTLCESFRAEPAFLRLLAAPDITKAQRCQILDDCFRGKLQLYLLNFLKILTEKGYIKQFSSCLEAYTLQYNADNNIMPVKAISAVALTADQIVRLEEKISTLTGKKACVENRVDPECLGGIVLDYDGTQVDGSVANRIENIRKLLKNTVL